MSNTHFEGFEDIYPLNLDWYQDGIPSVTHPWMIMRRMTLKIVIGPL